MAAGVIVMMVIIIIAAGRKKKMSLCSGCRLFLALSFAISGARVLCDCEYGQEIKWNFLIAIILPFSVSNNSTSSALSTWNVFEPNGVFHGRRIESILLS